MKGSASILTNVVSPHMLPFFRALAERLAGGVSYLATNRITSLRKAIGWDDVSSLPGVSVRNEGNDYESFVNGSNVRECDLLLLSVRDFKIIKHRFANNRRTCFQFERWFRPPYGMMLRMLWPPFALMAYRFARELLAGHYFAFPIGVHAARDMARLCGLVSGDSSCLFRAPRISFERYPGGRIMLVDGRAGKRYGLPNMRMWAYYIAGGEGCDTVRDLRVMWVGRYLACKRVTDIIEASMSVGIPVDLYGAGPGERMLRTKYSGRVNVEFHDPLSPSEVRVQMRQHAIYVFASNASDGWGVVVNEAMTEGMAVVGTRQAGASATLIEDGKNGLLYDAGDVEELKGCLRKLMSRPIREEISKNAKMTMATKWSPECAADYLLKEVL